ncbi:PP2C family protein-serine/threonine phosphatase [Methylotenera mobilis]|uniref:Protein serine/threonine phosphatase n=1 Tax=Methylotenera mobilis (strain JLW8 / ATCC BAA-1282 / DSM 17540) TaxID=583345 RepID=C6WUH5_METML|nr:PP2C family serine/threonine-protein phosphatase [Methylotenera mobilis]ACT47574.1 protein serine/threonine phosphatase [Methylotenera mobilis JLW8]
MQNVGFTIPKKDLDNGDRFLVEEISPATYLLVIADGVGSSSQPGYAAELAVNKTISEVKNNPDISFSTLFNSIKEVLVFESNKISSVSTLQTTLTVCILKNNYARVGHVGDTRLYHLRSSGLVTRTEDQTELKKLVDEGVISPIRAKNYPRKNVLLSVLASNRDFELYENGFDVQEKDRLMLISDGFYKVISKKTIIQISTKHFSINNLADELQEYVVEKGINDDCTCLVAEI